MAGVVTFDPLTHTYRSDGRIVPNTTSILKAAGFSYAYYREHDGDFGTVGHQVAHLFFADQMREYDPVFEPWMVGLRAFRDEQRPEPYISPERGLERILVGTHPIYAGTVDFAGTIKEWKKHRGIIDWKFWGSAPSSQILDCTGLQTTGYSHLMADYEMTSFAKRAAVWFFPGGYRIYHFRDTTDWYYFLSAVNCWLWREKHNCNPKQQED